MAGRTRPTDAIAFAERVLALLEEGRYTATYKYAVLLGLIDVCLEQTTDTGSPPTSVTTAQLARRVLALYWPHTLPYTDGSAPVLRQNAGSQSKILRAISDFRQAHAMTHTHSIGTANSTAPSAFKKLLRTVEWTLVEMPLPRLQVMGDNEDRFIYEINWPQDIKRKDFRLGFDNRILFQPNASQHLSRLAGVLRPVIQRHWANMVARLNRTTVQERQLDDFLFGATRLSTAPIRRPLLDLQHHLCFYCRRPITSVVEIDHFLPWSRHPDNTIQNLVAAHQGCNGAKRDTLATAQHLSKWRVRNDRFAAELRNIASFAAWEDGTRELGYQTLSVSRGVYLALPEGTPLWMSKGVYLPAAGSDIRLALGVA